jgi:thiosulfate/3-mercaptopyruvate sulfurtransferase
MSQFDLLVDPTELAERLDDPSVLVVDASVTLTRKAEGDPYEMASGKDGYDAAHIPGAVFADLLGAFSDPDGAFAFSLPSPERMADVAGALGIGPGVHVVAYTQDLPTFAPRLWWLLRYFGFDDVSVLDGGLGAWRAAGLPVTDEVTPPGGPRTFVAQPRETLVARRDLVERAAGDREDACLIHALSHAEFRGEGAPADARAGHIPGSANVPWYSVVDPETGRYRSPAELRDAFAEAGVRDDRAVITYCGGGIAASMDAFALALAGRDDVRVYDGSLAEWSSDPSLPLIRGS